MEQTIKRPVALAATGMFAVAAYWLRQRQIQSGGSFFTYFTVAVVVLLAVYALFLGRRKKHTAILSRSPLYVLGLCAAALAVTGGSAAMALSPAREFDRGLAVLGILAARLVDRPGRLQLPGQEAPRGHLLPAGDLLGRAAGAGFPGVEPGSRDSRLLL